MDIARYKTDIIHFLEHEYYVPDTERLIDFTEWEWQCDILKDIFVTKDGSGKRLYTTATVSTPRQQGKSLILQCVGLYMLIAGGRNLNIYSIACDKDQAALVPERVKKAIRLNPRLASAVNITRDVLHCPANGNSWTIMSSDQASAPGIQADVLLWDEMALLPEHQWNLVYLLLPSMSARPEPLMMIASTVGEFEEGPLDSFMALGRDETQRDTYLYETSEIKSPLTNQAQIERDKKLMPEAVWMRHYANTVVQGASFLSDEDIEAIIVPVDGEENAEGYSEQYIGCDWGLTKDKCAVVSIEKPIDGQYMWSDARLFRGSRQNPVDLNEAADAVRDLYKDARRVVFDKWQAIATIQQLQSEWGEDVVQGFDFTQSSRIRLFKNIFTIIRDRQFKIRSDILSGCWKQSCQTCPQMRCAEQIQHEFLRELQGLQCDANFKVTHGKRGDDITVATALALFEAAQEESYVYPKVLGCL